MGQWVVSVAGIAILSVLCDVILPEGQTRKYIKTVVGVIVTLVMLQPIVNFIGSAQDYNTSLKTDYSVNVQQSYLDMVENKQCNTRLLNAKNMLTANGIAIKDIGLSKEKQSVAISVDEKCSEDKYNKIVAVMKTYFPDYKVDVKWK